MNQKWRLILCLGMFSCFWVNCGEKSHSQLSADSMGSSEKLESSLFEEVPYSPAAPSVRALDNLTALKASLPDFSNGAPVTVSEIDPLLAAQFPAISPQKLADIFNRMKKLQVRGSRGENFHPATQMTVLTACSCDQALLEERVLAVLVQVQALAEKVPLSQRGKKIVHTAFGEEAYLQTYFFALALSEIGFRDVEIYGIGPYLESWNRHAALPGIQLSRHFATAYEYLDAIQAGTAFRSHSFDAIDVGPYHDAIHPTEAGVLFGFSGFQVSGTRISSNYQSDYFIVEAHKGSIQETACIGNYDVIYFGFQQHPNAAASEQEMQLFSRPLTESYCQGIQKRIAEMSAQSDLKAVMTQYSQEWLNARGLALHPTNQVRQYTTAWHEFAGLVSLAKAPNFNPVIVSLQNPITPGPVKYEGYFPLLGGRQANTRSWEGFIPPAP